MRQWIVQHKIKCTLIWDTARHVLYYSTALYYRARKRHKLHDVGLYRAQNVDNKRLERTS